MHSAQRKRSGLPTVGIIGGGQLARMMAQKAHKLGLRVVILDPDPHAPAGDLASRHVVAPRSDAAALRELGSLCDVITFEIEHVDIDLLEQLSQTGLSFRPGIAVMRLVQDKLLQKQTLQRAGLPTPHFADTAQGWSLPWVQKARRGGYDGRGVRIVRRADDIEVDIAGATYVEQLVELEKELAVIVVRGVNGEHRTYPVVEMEFDPAGHLLDTLVSPASIDPALESRCRELAVATAEALDAVGVLAVEMFLTRAGEILINEVAPRPHNSGHFTIEACVTCQFEQHLRAVMGLPLGDTDQLRPAAMINVLGQDGRGLAQLDGLHDALAVPGASVHIYGKREAWPRRKMGHATVLAPTIHEARERARAVRDRLSVSGVKA